MEPGHAVAEPVASRASALPASSVRPLRLLVGYDGRPASRDALSFAKALAQASEAELTVASVRGYWPDLLGESYELVVKEDEHWISRGATEVLGDIPFSVRVLPGGHEPAGLRELAATEGSDMIVVGSTHRGRVGRICPGSTGERLLDGATCAVVVTPRGLADREVSVREIAVGYDGSRASTVALRRAIGLAERSGASLRVLGAVEIALGLAGYETQQPKDLQRADMEHHLNRALQMIPPSVPAESRLLLGSPGRAIVEAATDVDLLVLGSRGSYGVLRRIVLGKVGAAAMRHASVPTLVTPTDS